MAMAIMKLATPSSYCYVANQFGMDKTMAKETIQEVGLVIQDILANCFIHLVHLKKVDSTEITLSDTGGSRILRRGDADDMVCQH
ncbi:hypothetical protein Y1Q_0024356 [Alligator mississippiensis]|uniref:Uncharacterized protein n=1 Tax=Alligator mississippiensis TaxID=8496 RepID=A0A151NJJ5_ALLMI|nr:hypothetical protein Y1Q_0024356 [Alligator mississippiensis]